MGNFCVRMRKVFRNKDIKTVMVGLDAAGKTSALYRLKYGQLVTTIPTIGCNEEVIVHNSWKFHMRDISGRDGVRDLWRHYYHGIHAVIFVIDSNDQDRIPECKVEVWRLLEEVELQDAAILILANKKDLPCAMSVEQVEANLGIGEVTNRKICKILFGATCPCFISCSQCTYLYNFSIQISERNEKGTIIRSKQIPES